MPIENWIIGLSFLCLIAILFYRDIQTKSWKKLAGHAVVLGGCFIFVASLFTFDAAPPEPGFIPKGEDDPPTNMIFIALMYLAMLLGMLASYAYKRLSQPETGRPPWDWGLFLAPVFVSPIIFIPLYTMLQDNPDGASNMMLLLIAFQNGFLWKEYFDQKKKTGGEHAQQTA